jgi:fermentation-respiration switch protein FrsA (DUF1100 family)
VRALARALSTERGLVRAGLAVTAFHIADDSYLDPAPGTSPGDHIASGLVPLLAISLAFAAYPRLRAGTRAIAALLSGLLGVVVGGPSVYYVMRGEASGDSPSGIVAIVAGVLLVALAPVLLWRSRRPGGRVVVRRSLRAVGAVAAAPLVALWVVLPVTLAYVYTHGGRTTMTPSIGVPLQRAHVTTSDSLELAAWYLPSRNRAAVILFPGADRADEARMLARHGYGVLLLEPRGQGGGEGDVVRWAGDRDLIAGADYLRARRDVDPGRIGAIGFSVGGEILLEAAARSPKFAAVVSEGAGERAGGAESHGLTRLLVGPSQAITTEALVVLSNMRPPAPIEQRIGRIAPRAVMLIYADPGQGGERSHQPRFFAAAHEPKVLWRVAGAKHTGGMETRPAEYERRVTAFLDSALHPQGA